VEGRHIVVLLIVGAAGYFAFSMYAENRALEDTRRAEAARKEQVANASVEILAQRTGARTDWEQVLGSGASVRLKRVLTIELERLWLGKQPILFRGVIDDVQTLNSREYLVRFSQGVYSGRVFLLDTALSLSLRCERMVIDPLISTHPDVLKGIVGNVAVVARIDRIRTERATDDDGQPSETKIGDGWCVGLVYTGDVEGGPQGGGTKGAFVPPPIWRNR
jgi:hypothetical protein